MKKKVTQQCSPTKRVTTVIDQDANFYLCGLKESKAGCSAEYLCNFGSTQRQTSNFPSLLWC